MGDADEDVAIDDIVVRATSTAQDDSTSPVITAPDRTVSDRGGAKSHMGKTAEITGAFTQSAGNILYADVTIKHAPQGDSIIKTGQVIAEYWSQYGDSGAPITHTDTSGNTKLLGIHVGRAYQLFLEPSGRAVYEGNVAAANPAAGSASFAVFSPWENISRDLGVS